MYMDPRFQTLLRQNHPHALYQQMASPYGPHLYGMMSGAPPSLAIPGYHERLKLEEEHRVRTMRAEEEKAREHEEKARKEQQDRDEKLRREQQEREEKLRREQKEKEQREKEKEMQMREQRQKESEARERERQMQHHLAALHAPPMQRQFGHMLNMFPMGMGLRPPSMMQHSLNPLSAHSMIQSGLGMSPHSLPMFGGNLPPPAHGYSNSMLGPPGSIVTPPSIASIASIGNNHYSPQMNHSPVPAAPQRDPQRDARERDMRDQRDQRELREHRASPQSLNLSKNPGNLANLSNLTNNLAAPLSLTTSKSNPSQPIAAPPVVSAVNLGINQINLSNSNAAGNNGQREMSGSLLVNLSNPGSIGVKAEKELIKDEPSDAMKAFKVDKVETNLKIDEKVELNLKMEDKMDEKLEKLVKSEIEEIPANLVKKEEPKNPKSPAEVVDKVEPSDKDEDKVVTPEPPKAKTPESIPEAVPAVSPEGNDKTAERAASPSEELPKTNPKSLETKNSAVKPKENEIKANDEFVTSKKR